MKKLVVLMLVVSLVGVSSAAIRYHGSGSWDLLEGVGQVEGWQSAVPPGSADDVRANWGGNTVTLNYETTVKGFFAGVDESGTFQIQSNGTLNAVGNSKVGNNNLCTGTMIIDQGGTVNTTGWLMVAGNSLVTGVLEVNGTLNANGHLWSATGAGSTATMDINAGGVINVAGMLGLGTSNATSDGGGVATLNVNDGGLLALQQIHAGILDPLSTGSSIRAGSMLNIFDSGMVTKTGNFVDVMEAYAAAGLISGNGIAGNVSVDLVDGNTVVTAIPEPATMLLLGLGGLLMRRKK